MTNPSNKEEQNKYKCSNCGFTYPQLVQMNIIPFWQYNSVIKLLVEGIGKSKCHNCSSEIDIPLIAILPHYEQRQILLFANDWTDNLLKDLPGGFIESDEFKNFQIHKINSIEEAKPIISEFVLHYKSLLKELSESERDKSQFAGFINDNWKKLTPSFFSAGMIGVTGLIPGIGGIALNSKTGEKADLTNLIKAFEHFFEIVQFMVWINIINLQYDASITLEKVINSHIVQDGIFGNNQIEYENFLKSKFANRELESDNIYKALALYGIICLETKHDSIFRDLWVSTYMDYEIYGSNKYIQISPKRIEKTIDEKSLWNYLSNRIAKSSDGSEYKLLKDITEKIGFKDIVDRVYSTIHINIETNPLDYMKELIDSVTKRDYLIGVIRSSLDSIISYNDPDLVDKIFKYAISKVQKDKEIIAYLEARYGQCLKEMRLPKRFLDAVGEIPREWEYNISVRNKIDLWNERANALRLLTKFEKALELTEKMLNEIKGRNDLDYNRFVLLRNRGILLRETGALDESLKQFEELINTTQLEYKAELLGSYAKTCIMLGEYKKSIKSLKEAIELTPTTIQKKNTVDSLKGYLVMTYTLLNEYEKAINIIDQEDFNLEVFNVLLPVATSYANIAFSGLNFTSDQLDEIQLIADKLYERLEIARESEDIPGQIIILQILGAILDKFNPNQAKEIWKSLYKLMNYLNMKQDPSVLGRLVAIYYQEKEFEKASRLLLEIPKLVNEKFGTLNDLSIVFNATRMQQSVFYQLMLIAIALKAPISDIRLILDIQRDVIGRSKLSNKVSENNSELPTEGITSEVITNMMRSTEDRSVIEIIDIDKNHFLLITTVKPNGKVNEEILEFPDKDIISLRDRILHLLSVWHTSRSGDPFELPVWVEFENWLHNTLRNKIDIGSHIIIIDSIKLSGIPWHVALSSHWKCTYATSWSSILNSSLSIKNKISKVGVFSVTRYQDSQVISDLFKLSSEFSKRTCDKNNLEFSAIIDKAADFNQLKNMLTDCDISKILCHGYVIPEINEVGLLVSNENNLPPMYGNRKGIASRHFVNWSDLQNLETSSRIVFSAACSSGIQLLSGAGERMGLFGALRQGGTVSYVGPRWDVIAKTVIPILDEIMLEYIETEVSLLDAWYKTCKKHEKKLSKWLAWSLTIEGNWI